MVELHRARLNGQKRLGEARVEEQVQEYLSYLRVERGSSPLTVAAYAADLKGYVAFLETIGITSVDDVDRHAVVAYEAHLFDRGYAASTVDRHVSVLKGFHRFLVREGYARRNPADTIQLPKAPDRLPDVLSVAQVDTMLSRPLGSGPLALRNQAILEVLYGCGLRVSECTGLDLSDTILEDGYLHIVGKGNKERIAPISGVALRALTDYLEHGRPELIRSYAKPTSPYSSTRAGDGSPARACTRSSPTPAAPSAWRTSTRTHCATRSPPTCCRAALTCALSRRSSVTPTFPPRRSTRTSTARTSAKSTFTPIPALARLARRARPPAPHRTNVSREHSFAIRPFALKNRLRITAATDSA